MEFNFARDLCATLDCEAKDGLLLRKDTGWCSDLPRVLDAVALPCNGAHQHELCLGGNAKHAQIYTKKLCRAVIDGLKAESSNNVAMSVSASMWRPMTSGLLP